DRLGPPCAGHSAVDDWYDPATSERPADVVASDRGRGGHYGRGDGHRDPAGQFRATETRRGSTGCFSRTYYDDVRTPTRVDCDPLDHRVALQLAVGGRDDLPGHLVHSCDPQARRSRRYLARPPDDLLFHRADHPGMGYLECSGHLRADHVLGPHGQPHDPDDAHPDLLGPGCTDHPGDAQYGTATGRHARSARVHASCAAFKVLEGHHEPDLCCSQLRRIAHHLLFHAGLRIRVAFPHRPRADERPLPADWIHLRLRDDRHRPAAQPTQLPTAVARATGNHGLPRVYRHIVDRIRIIVDV